MNVYDIITKKKQGKALSKEEIYYLIEGYMSGSIADYQMSALAMAICHAHASGSLMGRLNKLK